MATVSSYRDYESEAKDLIQSLIVSSVKRVNEEALSSINSTWPTVDKLSPESGQSAIEKFIEVYIIT